MPYPNTYGFNPYGGVQQNPMMQQPINMLISVAGIDAVKAYVMGPGSTGVFFDSNKPVMYIKRTDANCYPTIEAYSISKIDLEKENSSKTLTQSDVMSMINNSMAPVMQELSQMKEMLSNESGISESTNSVQSAYANHQPNKANGRRKSSSTVQSNDAN